MDNKIKISVDDASGISSVNFSGRLSFIYSIGLLVEGPASAQAGEALAVTTSPNFSILSLETLVGAGVATFEGFRTSSRTLAILLPLIGVAAGIFAVLGNSGSTGEICSFGWWSLFKLYDFNFSS
jgi:hypothetical protein